MTKDQMRSIDEALDLALEALIYASSYCDTYDAIAAIKQVRSAPVQEPVAWAWRISPNADHWQFSDEPHPEATRKRPLVFGDTTPPNVATPLAAQQDIQRLTALVRAQQITIDKLEAQRQSARSAWVGLTQDEFRDFASTLDYGTAGLIRAIETKLKAKNFA